MRKLSALLFALSLVAAACGDSAEDETTTSEDTSTSAPATTTPETTTSSSAATTTSTTAATTTSAESAEGTDDCVVGTWALDTEALVDDFDTLFESIDMPATEVTALEGPYTLEFSADGSFTGVRESWGFTAGMEGGNVEMAYSGTEAGTWSADGSTLTVDIESSDVTVEATMESGGQEMELPDNQAPDEAQAVVGANREYECSGDVLTITNSGFETTLNRA